MGRADRQAGFLQALVCRALLDYTLSGDMHCGNGYHSNSSDVRARRQPHGFRTIHYLREEKITMAVPFNQQDYKRLLKLAKAVSEHPVKGEISTWISDRSRGEEGCYTSLEIKGYLPPAVVVEILNCAAPVELTAEEMAINEAVVMDAEE